MVVCFLLILGFNLVKSRKVGYKFNSRPARMLAFNILTPLAAGAIFCFGIAYYHYYELLVPAMLMFYGVAILSAGKLSFDELRIRGVAELLLGAIAIFYPLYAVHFWGIGFGVFNIGYGLLMHIRK